MASPVHLVTEADAGDGGYVIGDGGSIITCIDSKKPQLFDLYENAVLEGRSKPVTLGLANNNFSSMVKEALRRITIKYNLNEAETGRIKSFIKDYVEDPFDLWELYLTQTYTPVPVVGLYLFNVRSVATEPEVINSVVQHRCSVRIGAINPFSYKEVKKRYVATTRKICSYGWPDIRNCVFQNVKLINEMTKSQRACLIVHESLRFLPEDKRPTSERQLRQDTAEICTAT
jgi:hypothetical protein